MLHAPATYTLFPFTTISNIDAIALNANAAGFNLTVADSQVSTADANGDGTQNDLQISASVAMTNGVTISASGLTGANHIVVIGTNLGGADTITGGAGDDTIEGGAGGDTLTGGAGTDTLVYSSSNAAVTVNLATNAASGGDAAGDVISGFENLTGSAFNDVLTGTSGVNVLDGGTGNDTITGGAGAD